MVRAVVARLANSMLAQLMVMFPDVEIV